MEIIYDDDHKTRFSDIKINNPFSHSNKIYMKVSMVGTDHYAVNLENGFISKFCKQEVVKPLNAKIHIKNID